MIYNTIPLGQLCTIEKGSTGIMKAVTGPYPMVTLAQERTSHNEYQFDTKAVIVPLISSTGHGHASMKRVHYQEGKFALGSILCALIPRDETELNARFLYNYLSFFKDSLLVPLMRGAANVSLSIKSIAGVTIPLPPLEEQLAINELAAFYSFKTKAFQTELQTQQTLLAQLRQAILQEAVQGKLTERWRAESEGLEPAETGSELLLRIRAEKAELIRQGKLRKEKPLPPITDTEKPFELPEGWVWCRLEEVCNNVVDCPHSTPHYLDIDTGYYAIDTNCINDDGSISHYRIVSEKIYYERIARLEPSLNDIIFSREGTIGLTTIVDGSKKICLGQRVMMFRPIQQILTEYFRVNLISPRFIAELLSKHKGMGAKHVNVKDIKSALIPLPSLAEQRAIITQVDRLMEQVSALENENKQQQAEVGRLMQVVLREAFAGKEVVEITE